MLSSPSPDIRNIAMARYNASSLSAVVDLFFKAGASRGRDLTRDFRAALAENADLALRLALWARDVRGGAGERKHFRDWLGSLARGSAHTGDHKQAMQLALRTPEVGRWDDLLVLIDTPLEVFAAELIGAALAEGNGLCAKWMPRKGEVASKLRRLLGMTPKGYRKTLVNLSETVEQLMCAGKWDEIEFRKVPSVAFSRYARAFTRRVPEKFTGFVEKVEKGEQKINASAIFPVDVIASLRRAIAQGAHAFYDKRHSILETTPVRAACEQWKALPDFMDPSARALVIADTSGSMFSPEINGATPMDVAVSLAMYMSERASGPFKDAFITFSTRPKLQVLKGTLLERIRQLYTAEWAGSTDLGAAFDLILNAAKAARLPESEMPSVIFVVSDMAFNGAVYAPRDYDHVRKLYREAGYEMPTVVFWNVRDSGNKPVSILDKNTALVSGYSPAVAKSVFSCKDIDPLALVLHTIGSSRYDLPEIEAA